MAAFREHVAVGALASVAAVVTVYFYALITDPVLLGVLFAVTIIGSFLPDVDSDSGLPFYFVFGAVTLAITGLAIYFALNTYADRIYFLIGVPLGVMFFAWFVLGEVFKRYTHHRGIFHSLPAMGIAALLTYLGSQYFGANDMVSLILALGMAAGFGIHLVMDEVHSEVNLDGNPFIPKRSLGTAFKLFSTSRGVTLTTYLLLATLAYFVVR